MPNHAPANDADPGGIREPLAYLVLAVGVALIIFASFLIFELIVVRHAADHEIAAAQKLVVTIYSIGATFVLVAAGVKIDVVSAIQTIIGTGK